MVPTPVRWEDINFPENWLKEHADRPTYRIPMRDLRDCISDLDGTLRISFRDRSLSSREQPSLQIPNYDDDLQSARNSLSSLSKLNIRNQIPSLVEQYQYQPNPNTRNQLPSLENRYKPGTSESSEPINLIPRQRRPPIPTTIEIPEIPEIPTHISRVHKTPEQVAHPIHTYDQEGPSSPTPSQVLTEIPDTEPQIRTINVLDTNPINYEILIAEYLSHKSRTKYESSYSQKKQDQFRIRWL